MGLITVSGEPGCRHEEVARLTANRLDYHLITEQEIRQNIAAEFGEERLLPPKAYAPVVTSMVVRLAVQHNLVIANAGAEFLLKNHPGILRVQIVAPESRRIGTLMVDHRLERPAAQQLLRNLTEVYNDERRRRFRRAKAPVELFDLVLNEEAMDSAPMSEIVDAAARAKGVLDQGLLSAAAEAQIQFQVNLELAKHGISPLGDVKVKRTVFVNQSEEIFANLLNFYRIAWQYEPKSFPIQWDKDGNVLESFTPDFYLPEFDMYIELTTMKQSLVTKKNRKVKLLKSIYPHVNIQVFYRKDFQNLIFKHGLAGAAKS